MWASTWSTVQSLVCDGAYSVLVCPSIFVCDRPGGANGWRWPTDPPCPVSLLVFTSLRFCIHILALMEVHG